MTNQVFVRLPTSLCRTLAGQVGMSVWEASEPERTIVRLATSWYRTEEDVDALLAALDLA